MKLIGEVYTMQRYYLKIKYKKIKSFKGESKAEKEKGYMGFPRWSRPGCGGSVKLASGGCDVNCLI
jgi:hypothetical protein